MKKLLNSIKRDFPEDSLYISMRTIGHCIENDRISIKDKGLETLVHNLEYELLANT